MTEEFHKAMANHDYAEVIEVSEFIESKLFRERLSLNFRSRLVDSTIGGVFFLFTRRSTVFHDIVRCQRPVVRKVVEGLEK